ncbi:hypothetical protein LMB92_00550, partial [Limosilactobacillus reuteri]
KSVMSFICCDAETHQIVTKLQDRLSPTIVDYFESRYSKANVNTDLKLSEITGLKMYFFTGLNAVLYVVPCNPSCDMIY